MATTGRLRKLPSSPVRPGSAAQTNCTRTQHVLCSATVCTNWWNEAIRLGFTVCLSVRAVLAVDRVSLGHTVRSSTRAYEMHMCIMSITAPASTPPHRTRPPTGSGAAVRRAMRKQQTTHTHEHSVVRLVAPITRHAVSAHVICVAKRAPANPPWH